MSITKRIFLSVISFGTLTAMAQQQEGLTYGRNLFSVSPIQMSERTPTGIGLQYERFLGPSSKLSLYLPVAYSFGHADACDPTVRARVFYAYPGIKFYPAGYKHKVTYAVGPSLVFGAGTTNCNCDEKEITTMELKVKEYKPVTEMGAIINNSVNIQASKHIYFGSDIGIGASYLNTLGGKDMGTDIILQMNVKVGYRL